MTTWIEYETPHGPVLEIRMQGRDVAWCGECGRGVWLDETTTERCVGDSGIVGHRFVCLPCARKIGLEPEGAAS